MHLLCKTRECKPRHTTKAFLDQTTLEEGVTLNLRIRDPEPVTLSIGPGGSISQEIHADTSNPRLWDVANSRILYVHIVNSNEFESITGRIVPESTISRKEALEMRGSSDLTPETELVLLEPDQTVPWFLG